METPKCKLCEDRDASPIKSHIYSYFFIKSLINPPGEAKRNNLGRSFSLSNNNGSTAHVERIPQKDFEELFGTEEMSEDEIARISMDPYSRPYILCSKCEGTRIRLIEDYFNDNIYKNNNKIIESNKQDDIDIFISNANNYLIRLFFISLIWRASLVNYNNFKLPDEIEEKLRNILNKSLGESIDESTELAANNKDIINQEPVFIATSKEFENPARNHIYIEQYKYYCLFEINEYSVLYFLNQNILKINDNLKGVENYIKPATINYKEDKFKIVLLDRNVWEHKLAIVEKEMADDLFNKIRKDFMEHYMGNKLPLDKIKLVFDSFYSELIDDRAPIGLKFSKERVKNLINKYTRH